MINLPKTIPQSEQLEALSGGITEVYRLIERYLGHELKDDFRKHITVTKAQLVDYLREHPGQIEKHIITAESVSSHHDIPAFCQKAGKWVSCWIDHGMPTDKREYTDIAEAAADYLMAYFL